MRFPGDAVDRGEYRQAAEVVRSLNGLHLPLPAPAEQTSAEEGGRFATSSTNLSRPPQVGPFVHTIRGRYVAGPELLSGGKP